MRVTTARMIGEPPREEDLDELAALLADERVGATMGGVADREQAAEFLARHIEHWRAHGFGYWMWRDPGTGALAGRGGLAIVTLEGRDEVEVGWTVVPERWGEGLGTEMGAAAVRHAFDVLDLDSVVAFTLPHNAPSRRVMEKLGFQFEREGDYKGWDHVFYRLAR